MAPPNQVPQTQERFKAMLSPSNAEGRIRLRRSFAVA